jgi:hypothetical protein
MAERKRPAINTVAGQIATAKAVLSMPECPIKLTPEELEIYKDIIAHREAASWTRHDLRIAGQLARCAHHIDQLQDLINLHGYTMTNDRGTTVENSELRSLGSLTATQLNLNKTLGLAASQRGLSNANQDNRNKADRAARKVLDKASMEDDLV